MLVQWKPAVDQKWNIILDRHINGIFQCIDFQKFRICIMFSICNSSCIMMVQKESKVGYIENISLLLIAASTPLSFPKNSLCYCKWNQKHWDFPDVSIECWTRFVPLRTKSVRNIMLFSYDNTDETLIPANLFPFQKISSQKRKGQAVSFKTACPYPI